MTLLAIGTVCFFFHADQRDAGPTNVTLDPVKNPSEVSRHFHAEGVTRIQPWVMSEASYPG